MKNLFFILFLIAFLAGTAAAEEFFTWTDEDGVVHMGNAPTETPSKKTKVKSYDYQDGTPQQRQAEKNIQDYKYKSANAAHERDRRLDQAREDYALRDKARKKERCAEARTSEKQYRYEYRNARTDRAQMFWKSKLDQIEEICRQAE